MGAPIRFTIKDLELFPDPLGDTRYEIINGELYESKQPKVGTNSPARRLRSARARQQVDLDQ